MNTFEGSFDSESEGKATPAKIKAQIKHRGIGRGKAIHQQVEIKKRMPVSRRPESLGEYIIVPVAQWDDFVSTAKAMGLDFSYSIEDATEGGGIEYHGHSHLDEAEDILWAIQVLNEYEKEALQERGEICQCVTTR